MTLLNPRRILVPVGGRPCDDEALKLACSVAKRSKAVVYAVYVIRLKPTVRLDADVPSETMLGEKALSHAERVAEESDYELETVVLQSREIGPAIVDQAAGLNIDLIIMGLEYKVAFGDFSLGSVAPYVLENASCRVWLCREAPKEPSKSGV